jgi:hypothetical protein
VSEPYRTITDLATTSTAGAAVRRSTEMYTLNEALAREHMRELRSRAALRRRARRTRR